LNGCNKGIVVPRLDLKITVQAGVQTVEFTPQETGVVPWSCWMGMITGSFVVVENRPESATPTLAEKVTAILEPARQRLQTWAKQWRDWLESP